MKAHGFLLRLMLGGLIFFVGAPASAHTVYSFVGNRHIVVCDNGYVFDFAGSVEGAYDVADILCPDPPVPPLAMAGPRTVRPLPHAEDFVEISRSGRYRLRSDVAAALRNGPFRGYPPHGYPCLGCEPCPNDRAAFCASPGLRPHPRAEAAGWHRDRAGRLVRRRGRNP